MIDGEGAYEGRCLGTGRPKRRGDPVEGVIELAPDCSLQRRPRRAKVSPRKSLGTSPGDVGAGILKFGPARKNLGLAFFLIRLPEDDA